MKIFKSILAASAFCVFVLNGPVHAQPASQNGLAKLPGNFISQAERPCVFPVGGWAKVDCSAVAAATSAQLNPWTRYVVQCGSDSYIAYGDEATDVADNADGWLPKGSWLPFITTLEIRYFSCLNVSVDTDCRLLECR